MINLVLNVIIGVFFAHVGLTIAGTKTKPHSHTGLLEPYDGKHIAYNISVDQNQKLNLGEPVTVNQRSGKDGRGIVIQDVHAHPMICMDRIRDLDNYHKMVPKVNKVVTYSENIFANGSSQVGAEFNVGISLLKFRYYLLLTHQPHFNTLTWTLDYQYSSDFDDTTGHWQVMKHPTKEGWSRVLYSTQVKLPPWIPEFVITFLTKTALVESTTWVRRESEKVAATLSDDDRKRLVEQQQAIPPPDLTPCFVENEYGARYDTYCAHGEPKPADPPVTEEAGDEL